MIRLILIFSYIGGNILLFFFNWDLFTTVVYMDMIFFKAPVMPFLIVQPFGLIILLFLWLHEHNKDIKQDLEISMLRKKLLEIERDREIEDLRNKLSEANSNSEKKK